MTNETLNRIKDFARTELMKQSSYCGVAEGDHMAMLNSETPEGKDIVINITIEE